MRAAERFAFLDLGGKARKPMASRPTLWQMLAVNGLRQRSPSE